MSRTHRRLLPFLVVSALLGVVALTGCASRLSTAGAAPSATPSQCAVAENPNGEPPPEGCVVYDPEQNMADNQRWRDRVEISADAQAAGESYVEAVTQGLSDLQDSGTVTADGVRQVFLDEGFDERSIAVFGDDGNVGFGVTVSVPTGTGFAACLFGEVGPDGVRVDVGGPIMDGGCLEGPGGH